MATNRRAYIKSFCIATQQLDDFIELLDSIMNFHKDVLFTSLEKCRGDTKKVLAVFRLNFSDKILDLYRKYSIEAGRAIHKFQNFEVKIHLHKIHYHVYELNKIIYFRLLSIREQPCHLVNLLCFQ